MELICPNHTLPARSQRSPHFEEICGFIYVMPDPHSLDYVVRSGLAGGIAGCAAKTLIAPMDRVKILFQTGNPEFSQWAGRMVGLPRAIRHIWLQEGPFGLLRGHSATLARVFPYAAIKFVAYEQFRAFLIPDKSYETHIRRFASGSLAGLLSVIFTYPLDVIRVQLAYTGSDPAVQHNKHRLIHAARELWNKPSKTFMGKLKNLYPGFGPTMFGIVPYAGVSFFAHDLGHDIFRSPYLYDIAVDKRKIKVKSIDTNGNEQQNIKRPQLKGWAQILAGGVSGILAQTAAYPLEVIRRRMQVGGLKKQIEGSLQNNFRETTKSIYKEHGFRGFFVGLSIGFIKVGPMFACSFYVYERMKYLLDIN